MPLRVIWNRNADLNCVFEELFQIPPGITELHQPVRPFPKHYAGLVLSLGMPEYHLDERLNNLAPLKSLLALMERSGMQDLRRGLLYGLRRLNQLLFSVRGYERAIYIDEMRMLVGQRYDFRELGRYRTIYLQGYLPFFTPTPTYDSFKPTPPLATLIEQISSSFPPKTVGVHIRRTDHAASIKKSPTALFIAEMRRELALNPDTRFFLATDSPHEERLLRRIFPHELLIHDKKVPDRRDPQSIKDALVDLFCLSRTSRLLASCHSTFSRTAALLGNIPYKEIMAE
jgi:hypothetical protein